MAAVAQTYYFEGVELDTAVQELRRGGQAIALSSLSFSLLEYLLLHRDRVVSASELRAHVWHGVAVSEGTLRQAIWELRQVIGDDGATQRIVKTVRGRGYRFVANVEEPGRERSAQAQAPASAPLPTLRLSPLLGREAELSRAQAVLAEARQVSGRALVLMGTPGAGKTRLAYELRARATDTFVVEGRGEPDGVAPALGAWQAIVRGLLEAIPAAERARFVQRLPPAFAQPDSQSTLEAGEASLQPPAEQRAALFKEVVSLIVDLARERPGLILLEDLQWVDEDAVALLEQVVHALPQTRSLLLLTCRPPTREQVVLARVLRSLSRATRTEQIELVPLTEAHVADLLETTLPPAERATLAREVHGLSRGNPLLTLELVRLAATSRAPFQTLLEQPDPLLGVLRRRLDTLELQAHEALLASSVWGLEFSLREVSALLEEAPARTLARIDVPLAEGILLEVGQTRLRFSHPLFRQVAYAALSRTERARLHRAAFGWLKAQGADVCVARLGELTLHAVEAAPVGLARDAVDCSVRSAERAYKAAAYSATLHHYDRALECLELVAEYAPRERIVLELARGEALRASGADVGRVNAHFLRLTEQAEAIDDRELFARAVVGYTGHRNADFSPAQFAIRVDHQVVDLIERALSGLPPTPSELRVLLHCSLAYILITSTDRARRELVAELALADARALGIPWLLARVLKAHIYCCAAPDRQPRRRAHCDELVALTRRTELSALLPDALSTRAICLLGDLEYERASRDAQEARDLAANHPSAYTRARATLLELSKAFWQGDLDTAERLSRASLDAAPHDIAERALFTVRTACIVMLRFGLTPEVVALREGMLGAYPEAVTIRCDLSNIYAVLGRREEAIRCFDFVAEDDFKRLPEDMNWLSEIVMLGDAATNLADPTRAQLIYDRLLPYSDRLTFFAGEACPGATVAMTLGDLAITMQRYDLAEHWLDLADRCHEKLSAHFLYHFALLSRARLVHARNPDQVATPRALLRKAALFAHRQNLGWLRSCAERVGRQILGTAEASSLVAPYTVS